MVANIEFFVQESNRIEGILDTTVAQIEATERFVSLPFVCVEDVEVLVHELQPGAYLRRKPGMNVRVGDHVAPPGGPEIREDLVAILASAHSRLHPWDVHLAYETLHPFMDGNGRSGRALWAWQMVNQGWDGGVGLRRGFLHQHYYQSLSRARARAQASL
jgi:hypothetical protein